MGKFHLIKKALVYYCAFNLFLLGLLGVRSSFIQWDISWSQPNRIGIVFLTVLLSGILFLYGIRFLLHQQKVISAIDRIPEGISISLVVLFTVVGTSLFFILFQPPQVTGFLTPYWHYFDRLNSILIMIFAGSVSFSIFFFVVYVLSRIQSVKENPQKEASKKYKILLTGIISIFLMCEFLVYSHQSGITLGGDADDYLFMADYPVLTAEFYSGTRPFTTALFYKVMGANTETIKMVPRGTLLQGDKAGNTILLGQYFIHVFCWGFLGLAITSIFSSKRLQLVGTSVVLLIALSPPVQIWNSIIGSDNISISLTVLLIGIFIFLLKSFSWHTFYALLFCIILWANTRETNALILLALFAIILVISLLKKSQRKLLILAFAVLIIYGITSHFSDIRNRWAIPLVNVIYNRVLPDKQNLAFFEAKGMPINSAVFLHEGRWACDPICPYGEPAIDSFWKWVSTKGRSVYIQYLLKSPVRSLVEPFKHLKEIIGIKPGIESVILPNYFWNLLYFNGIEWVQLILLLPLGICLILSSIWMQNPTKMVFIIVFVLLYPLMFISYHGDAMEVYRHSILVSILVRLVFWVFLVLCLDWAISHRKLKQEAD